MVINGLDYVSGTAPMDDFDLFLKHAKRATAALLSAETSLKAVRIRAETLGK